MASLNARAVAMDALKIVEKGGLVNHRQILLKHGYSASVAKNPDKVIKTKSYQNIINKATNKMDSVRAKALRSLDERDPNKEKYATLISGVDILTKNIQLLTGKSTENLALNIQISEAIANKYADVSNNDNNEKPVSNEGSTKP